MLYYERGLFFFALSSYSSASERNWGFVTLCLCLMQCMNQTGDGGKQGLDWRDDEGNKSLGFRPRRCFCYNAFTGCALHFHDGGKGEMGS